jgi:hypothetical protein
MINKAEPTLEIQMTLTNMLDTIEALAKQEIELFQIMKDAEPGSKIDIDTCNKLVSIIDTKQEMESIVMEATKGD